MQQKKTLILGASENPERYSYLTLQKLKSHHHPVLAIGRRKATVNDIEIVTNMPHITDVHTVTLYLNPKNQEPYYDYILSLKPHRIIFNPGTENDTLEALARAKGIQTQQACTLVLLSTGQY